MLRNNGRDCPNEVCKYNNPMDTKTCLVCHTPQNMEIFNCGQCTLKNEVKFPKCQACMTDKPTRTTADVLAEVPVKPPKPPKKKLKTDKPLTGYNIFQKEKYPLLAQQQDKKQQGKNMNELSQQLGDIWKTLKDEDKAKYDPGKEIPPTQEPEPAPPSPNADPRIAKLERTIEANKKKMEKMKEEKESLVEKCANMKAKIAELKEQLDAKKNEKSLAKAQGKIQKAETKKKEDQMREVLSQGVWMNIEEKDIDEHLTFLGLPTDGEKSHKRCRLLGAIERQQTYKDGKMTSERLAQLCGQLELPKTGDYAARRNTILRNL